MGVGRASASHQSLYAHLPKKGESQIPQRMGSGSGASFLPCRTFLIPTRFSNSLFTSSFTERPVNTLPSLPSVKPEDLTCAREPFITATWGNSSDLCVFGNQRGSDSFQIRFKYWQIKQWTGKFQKKSIVTTSHKQ